jgi:hypothetical protein
MKTLMIKILLTYISLFIFNVLFAQDKIILTSGRKLDCKIIGEDSINIYVILHKSGEDFNTSINKKYIQSVNADKIEKVREKEDEKSRIKNEEKVEIEQKVVGSPIDSSIVFPHKNFVYLFSGKKIESINNFEYREPFIGSNYFIVDNDKYPSSEVAFYHDYIGYYANIKKLTAFEQNNFAERVIAGRINVYEYTRYNAPMMMGGGYSGGGMMAGGYGGAGMMVGGGTQTSSYYNRDFRELKKISYGNLILDLNDNPKCVSLLNEYHKASNNKILWAVTGSAFLIAGLVVASNQVKAVNGGETDKQQNYFITYSLFGGFIASYTVAIVFHYKKGDKLILAIKKYNE